MFKDDSVVTHMAYRPDIDGLRAIAVLAVIFYHLGWSVFSGGFVGVDIFLVISGYLITGIVRRHLSQQRFSLPRFYLRRIKRLLPALLVTVALSFIPAYVLLPPPELKQMAGSAVAALLSVANLFFWSGSGYFESDAISQPLLHTWSLGVEEQFYLVWPLVLLLLMPLSIRAGRYWLLLIGGVSLVAAEWMVRQEAATAFFWMPFRIAEFAVGAYLAWSALPAKQWPTRLADAVCCLGLAAIGYAVIMFDADTPFPGLTAMLPVLGAGMIIAVGAQSRIGAWLGHPVAVRVGLLAYALYLVHWPLIVFTHYALDHVTWWHDAMLLMLMVGLAYLLNRYVETPWREADWSWAVSHWRALGVAISFGGVVFLASLAWWQNGWGFRYSDALMGSIRDMQTQRADYWKNARADDKTFTTGDDAYQVAVIGNSFAVDIYYALQRHEPLDVVLSHNSYYFCYGLRRPYQADHMERHGEHCHDTFARIATADYVKNAQTLVINERWRIQHGVASTLEALDIAIRELRAQNPEAHIVLVGPRMTFTGKPHNVYEKVIRHGQLDGAKEFVSADYAFSLDELSDFDQGLATYATANGFGYISLQDLFCDASYCEILTPEQENLYWDEGHWSRAGAQELHRQLARGGHYDQIQGQSD